MNIKKATNSHYQQLNVTNKLSKQEQRQYHGYIEHFHGCHMGGGSEGMGEEVRGVRSTNRQLQNSHAWEMEKPKNLYA